MATFNYTVSARGGNAMKIETSGSVEAPIGNFAGVPAVALRKAFETFYAERDDNCGGPYRITKLVIEEHVDVPF